MGWSGQSLATVGLVFAAGCSVFDPTLLDTEHFDESVRSSDAGKHPPVKCEPSKETCNNVDDDCDGETDEESSDSCAFNHATGACASLGTCLLVECEDHYFDCNEMSKDGCETREEKRDRKS